MQGERREGRGSRRERRGGERLGVLGGTFDPPHAGHRALALAARGQLGLDRVLLVVAGDPWQKRGAVDAAAEDRVAMTEALAAEAEGLEVSRIEVDRGGPSYTADTLEQLARPERELVLIVGSDVAASLHTWHDPGRVRELATIAVAGRPDGAPGPDEVLGRLRGAGWACEEVQLEPVPVSSTGIREALGRGEAPDGGSLPPGVARVIEERGLYSAGP